MIAVRGLFLLVLQHSFDLVFRKTKPASLFGVHHSADGRVIHFVDVFFVMRLKLGRIRLAIDFFNDPPVFLGIAGSLWGSRYFGQRGRCLSHKRVVKKAAASSGGCSAK